MHIITLFYSSLNICKSAHAEKSECLIQIKSNTTKCRYCESVIRLNLYDCTLHWREYNVNIAGNFADTNVQSEKMCNVLKYFII